MELTFASDLDALKLRDCVDTPSLLSVRADHQPSDSTDLINSRLL